MACVLLFVVCLGPGLIFAFCYLHRTWSRYLGRLNCDAKWTSVGIQLETLPQQGQILSNTSKICPQPAVQVPNPFPKPLKSFQNPTKTCPKWFQNRSKRLLGGGGRGKNWKRMRVGAAGQTFVLNSSRHLFEAVSLPISCPLRDCSCCKLKRMKPTLYGANISETLLLIEKYSRKRQSPCPSILPGWPFRICGGPKLPPHILPLSLLGIERETWGSENLIVNFGDRFFYSDRRWWRLLGSRTLLPTSVSSKSWDCLFEMPKFLGDAVRAAWICCWRSVDDRLESNACPKPLLTLVGNRSSNYRCCCVGDCQAWNTWIQHQRW